MAERVVLHVGLMKSGTTFVQRRLSANPDVLADQGFLFPGRTWSDQVRATAELYGFSKMGRSGRPGAWNRLYRAIERHDGTALVSMEFLAPARPENIAKVAAAFAGVRLDVVLTLRDLGRNVPAMWQESMKNGRTWTWSDYVREIHEGGPGGAHFWRQQAAAKIVRRWAAAVGPDAMTIVVVPPPGAPRNVLWDRFAEAVGLAPATWASGGAPNPSLGAASAQVLRRLNLLLADLDWADYQATVKGVLGNQELPAHTAHEPAIGFQASPWLHRRSRAMRAGLHKTGVRVLGSLEELNPCDVPGVDPDLLPLDAQLDAALFALAGGVRREVGQRRERRARRITSPRSLPSPSAR